MTQERNKPGRGCLFYTGIAVGISALALIVASYLGYRYARQQIDQFTDTKPMELPAVRLDEDERAQVRERVSGFIQSVEQGNTPQPLVLSGDEINALIATHPDLVTVRGQLHFELKGTNCLASFSIPAEDLGLKPLKGRYVNASGEFLVTLTNGVLNANAESLSAKGKPLPRTFMDRIRPQNFAYRINQDERGRAFLERIEDVQIRDGLLVLYPRGSRTNSAAGSNP